MKTEIEEFKQFFKRYGVSCGGHKYHPDICSNRVSQNTEILITVAQAHFHFDKAGKYLGVEADEMGGFDAREKPTKVDTKDFLLDIVNCPGCKEEKVLINRINKNERESSTINELMPECRGCKFDDPKTLQQCQVDLLLQGGVCCEREEAK